MLTTAQIQTELAKISYKHGWTFTAYDGQWEGQHLQITTQVADAYHPGRTVTLDVHSMLPPMPDVDYLHRWLAWRLIRLESHEAREFLCLEGRPIYDPHAEHADRDQE